MGGGPCKFKIDFGGLPSTDWSVGADFLGLVEGMTVFAVDSGELSIIVVEGGGAIEG